jgi:molecular chaperone DnaJ
MAKDFYAILGISKSATEAEIKQAYRKLSRELHPDKHKGDKEKEAKFKEVNEAYEVLSDPKKKEAFDRFGSADGSQFQGGGFGGFSGFQGFNGANFQGGDFSDLFESFFSSGAGRRGRESGKGRNVEAAIRITFAEAVSGTERQVAMKTHIGCDECGGSGSSAGAAMVSCAECGGTGAIEKTTQSLFGMIRQSTVCPRCSGSGKVPEKPCKKCQGTGRVMEKKTVTVHIPAGIDTGQTLRLTGEGEAGQRGEKSGDLLVHIEVESDARFERDGDDIRSRLTIDVLDAVLGADKEVDTVHGPVTFSVPAGTQPGQMLRIKSKGMPVIHSSRHGDHYITVEITIPTKLSREEKKAFEELRKMK